MIDGRISKRREFSLGADPEMFVYSGLKLIPAYEFLPSKGAGELQYWDGFQAEWKYDHDGNHCQNNLVKYTRENLMLLDARAKAHDPQARLTLRNVVRVPQATLDTADPRHVELGCQPSYNAYNMRGKPVENPRKLPYRFAGGHMHFGTWTAAKPNYEKIIKTLDNILGVWSVGVARNIDNSVRRQYYGLAGEYRKPEYKPHRDVWGDLKDGGYGVEYRSLSNWWLASPRILQLTYDLGRMCVRLGASRYRNLWAGNEQETIETINNCDYDRAYKIMKRNEPMLYWLLRQVYRKHEFVKRAIELSYNSLESEVPEPENFAANWHFGEEWPQDAMAVWARWQWA